MSRVCDAGAFCLQKPQCEYRCHLTNAVLEPEQETLKIPASTVPEDLETETQTLHTMGSILLGLAMAVLLVFFLLMLFTGMWIWSLLI